MTRQDSIDADDPISANSASAAAALRDKLVELLTPGYAVEFHPDEAEQAGAFAEDALGLEDAAESCLDRDDAAAAMYHAREPS